MSQLSGSQLPNQLGFHDVVDSIRTQRFRTLLVVAVMTSAAILYSIVVPSKYETFVIFSPPDETDISPLSLTQVGVQTYKPHELFYFFKKALAKRNEQAQFLENELSIFLHSDIDVTFDHTRSTGHDEKTGDFEVRQLSWRLMDKQEKSLRDILFSNYLDLRIASDPDNPDYLALHVTGRRPETVHHIAARFPNYINSRIVESQVRNLRGGIERSRQNIRSLIEFKKEVARRERMDQITIIEDAIVVAENLGLEDPAKIPTMHTVVQITPPEQFFLDPKTSNPPPNVSVRNHQDADYMEDQVYSPPVVLLHGKRYLPSYRPGDDARNGLPAIETTSIPLYLRGARALREEVALLRNRASDDFLIPHLRSLEAEERWLNQINIDTEKIRVFRIEEPSFQPTLPTSPRYGLIIFIGFALGIILSLIIALIRYQRHLPIGGLKHTSHVDH